MSLSKRDQERQRLDALITEAIRTRYAHNPARAKREVVRYETFMANYRQGLAPEPPSLARFRHAAAHWSGWAGAHARAKLKQGLTTAPASSNIKPL